MRKIHVTIPNNFHHMQLGHLFQNGLKLSKKQVHLLRMTQSCKRNGSPILFTDQICAGDVLEIPVFEKEKYYDPKMKNFSILYEDDHVLVIDKPSGLKVHPNERMDAALTLCNGVADYLQRTNQVIDVRYIHRLDEHTSGTILFAKHAYAHTILDRHLSERKIKRTYIALCKGVFTQKRGTIRAPLGKVNGKKQGVVKNGLHAITHYRVLKQGHLLSLVQFELETGRTHQIRAHAAYLGHPICGDDLYGDRDDRFTTQMLHAFRLTFFHPFSLARQTVEAAFPKAMVVAAGTNGFGALKSGDIYDEKNI